MYVLMKIINSIKAHYFLCDFSFGYCAVGEFGRNRKKLTFCIGRLGEN